MELRSKAREYFRLLRPFTLLAPVVGGFLFGWMSLIDQKRPIDDNLPSLFLSCFILAMANATSNILNQVFDRDIDLKHPEKRNRPVPSGMISLDGAMSVGVVLLIFTLFMGWFIFGTYYGILLTIILGFSWMYNSPPPRLKMRLGWGNLAIAAPRGGLGLLCAYSAFGNPMNPPMILACLYFGVYVFGVNTMKDFSDCEWDKKCGVRNFVTVYGKRKASEIVTIFLFIPFMILLLGRLWVQIPSLTFLPIIFSFVIAGILWHAPELRGKTENSIIWVLFYLQLMLMMVFYVLPRV